MMEKEKEREGKHTEFDNQAITFFTSKQLQSTVFQDHPQAYEDSIFTVIMKVGSNQGQNKDSQLFNIMNPFTMSTFDLSKCMEIEENDEVAF